MTISVTSQIDLRAFKDEMLNYVVNKLYSSDPKSRYSQTTTTFSGDASTTGFELSSTLRAITSVSISSVSQDYGEDYLPIFDSESATRGYIEFTSAPGSGTDNISVTYISGTPGWIYTDFPRKDLALSRYPRIAVGMIPTTVEGGLGGASNVLNTQIRVSILFLSENTRELDEFQNTLNTNLNKDAKDFYNWRYILPENARELSLGEDVSADIVARNQDYTIPDRYEIITYN